MINSLKDIEKLMKLCRKQGITEFVLKDLVLRFGELPQQQSTVVDIDPENPYSNFPQGELTPEQLAFYSAGGIPEEDPENVQ